MRWILAAAPVALQTSSFGEANCTGAGREKKECTIWPSLRCVCRRQEKLRTDEYMLQLQEMQNRVESRPYLFERVMQVRGGGSASVGPGRGWGGRFHPTSISYPNIRRPQVAYKSDDGERTEESNQIHVVHVTVAQECLLQKGHYDNISSRHESCIILRLTTPPPGHL